MTLIIITVLFCSIWSASNSSIDNAKENNELKERIVRLEKTENKKQ